MTRSILTLAALTVAPTALAGGPTSAYWVAHSERGVDRDCDSLVELAVEAGYGLLDADAPLLTTDATSAWNGESSLELAQSMLLECLCELDDEQLAVLAGAAEEARDTYETHGNPAHDVVRDDHAIWDALTDLEQLALEECPQTAPFPPRDVTDPSSAYPLHEEEYWIVVGGEPTDEDPCERPPEESPTDGDAPTADPNPNPGGA